MKILTKKYWDEKNNLSAGRATLKQLILQTIAIIGMFTTSTYLNISGKSQDIGFWTYIAICIVACLLTWGAFYLLLKFIYKYILK